MPILAIVEEAITTPCAIRFDTAAEALAALPADLRKLLLNGLDGTVRSLLELVVRTATVEPREPQLIPAIERSLMLLGRLAQTDVDDHTRNRVLDLLAAILQRPLVGEDRLWIQRAIAWELGGVRHSRSTELLNTLDPCDDLVAVTVAEALRSLEVVWPEVYP